MQIDWMVVLVAILVIQVSILILCFTNCVKTILKILIRVELIHEYILYGNQKTYKAEPTALLEMPNARSEAAKKRWAKKKSLKQPESL